jgi:hypothetical protein
MKKSPEELYKERVERLTAAINLKTPDRVPIEPSVSGTPGFVARYGGVTVQELMYNYAKHAKIVEKLMEAFPEWDAIGALVIWPASAFDATGQVLYKLPGRELSPDVSFQFVEECHMEVEEYDLLIENPTEFLVTKYFPRIFKEEWEKGPTRAKIAMMKGIFANIDHGAFWDEKLKKWEEDFGMPIAGGGMTKAPFDVLSDTLRGMRELSLDLYRRPEKVIEACEALVPYCVMYAELPHTLRGKDESARKGLKPQVFMPLHRGCVPFMSMKQFETFYWPTLKEVIHRLAADGFICRPFAEGDWTMNMKFWREVPKGKVVLHIDLADIFKAKELVGDNVCLQGNVPATLLELGTPQQVEKYCKKLIDIVGEGGGFFMDGAVGIPDGAKLENVVAMTRFTAKYGVYRR